MIDLQHQELSNYPVGSDDRATFSEIARWISVVALLVCLILAYAWSRNEILNMHYQMERLRKENNELREINATLRAEHSSLINPESVYREASKLGLVSSNRAEVRIPQFRYCDSSNPPVRWWHNRRLRRRSCMNEVIE